MNPIFSSGKWLFLLLVFTTMCGKSEADLPQDHETATLSREGSVLCEGNGVANVVVTDGINFTSTGSDGKYSLPYNASTRLVYISSPAGYTVPVEKSVPLFWKNTKKQDDQQSINFNLIRLTEPDNQHYFIAVGDPQVRNTNEINLLKPILQEMKATIAEKKIHPVHLMVAGDIVFDTPQMHDQSKECFAAVGEPVYYAIGNHDHLKTSSVSASNDRTSDSTYIRHYGPTYYSFNRGMVHYIVLDNIFYEGGAQPVYHTEFTQEELNWVKSDLSYVSKDKALVVMFHAPSMTRNNGVTGNSADLHALLKGYDNVQLISGHTHYNSVVDDNQMTEHIVGAACGGFWEGPVCLDGSNLGYKIFEVDGTTFKWEYHDYTSPGSQFSVFQPNAGRPEAVAPGNELLINVWDWDPEWEVSYAENNSGTFKPMQRYTWQNPVYDPLAYDFFGIKGDNTVSGRSWLGASKTDHIFYVIPSEGVSKITIKVKSRFKTYTKDIDI